MKKIITGIFICVTLFSLNLTAQDFSKAGTSAAQFLKIPVGAKATGMAYAYTSLVDDATALYWNPSGITSMDKVQGTVSHSTWIAGLAHSFLGIIVPAGEIGTFGISAIALQTNKIEQTTIELPEGTGTYFDALDFAVGMSYARAMTENVHIGATVKYINQRIWNESAETFAVDLGAILTTGFKDMKIGLSFQNFGPDLKMSGRELIRQVDQDPNSTMNPYVETAVQTQEWGLPTSYRVSTSLSLIGNEGLMQLENSQFILALDAVHLNDNPEHYSIGGEYRFAETFAVRGGYVFQTDEEGLTLGAGLNIPMGSTSFSFDYGYAVFGILGSVQQFTLSASL
jgi:hypothetical protein